MERLTRVEMAAIIDGGQTLIFNGVLYSNSADLPTQDEIDAIYGSGISVTVDTDPITDRMPPALDADGGFKVHLQNPEDIGGGGEGGGLTDTELRATPVPVSGTIAVSNLPAAQPVTDNGGSLTVDGTVAVSNFPATQPVSGTVAVSNFPATQPVSAAALPLPTGAATDAGLTAISAQLPAALSSGALKVDLVGNTAGVGGASAPAPVVLQSNAAIAATSTMSAAISGRGYKGIRIRLQRTNTTANTMNIAIVQKLPDGTYTSMNGSPAKGVLSNPTAMTSGTAGFIDWTVFPNAVAVTGTVYSVPPQQTIGYVPDDFKIEIVMSNTTSSTVYLEYQLLA